jgi:hypothetical protein
VGGRVVEPKIVNDDTSLEFVTDKITPYKNNIDLDQLLIIFHLVVYDFNIIEI